MKFSALKKIDDLDKSREAVCFQILIHMSALDFLILGVLYKKILYTQIEHKFNFKKFGLFVYLIVN